MERIEYSHLPSGALLILTNQQARRIDAEGLNEDADAQILTPWPLLIPVIKAIGSFLAGSIACYAAFRGIEKLEGFITGAPDEYDAYAQHLNSLYSSEFADSVANRVARIIAHDRLESSPEFVNETDEEYRMDIVRDRIARSQFASGVLAVRDFTVRCESVSVPSAVSSIVSDAGLTEAECADRLIKLGLACLKTDPEFGSLCRDLGGLLMNTGAAEYLACCYTKAICDSTGLDVAAAYDTAIREVEQCDSVAVRRMAVAAALYMDGDKKSKRRK